MIDSFLFFKLFIIFLSFTNASKVYKSLNENDKIETKIRFERLTKNAETLTKKALLFLSVSGILKQKPDKKSFTFFVSNIIFVFEKTQGQVSIWYNFRLKQVQLYKYKKTEQTLNKNCSLILKNFKSTI